MRQPLPLVFPEYCIVKHPQGACEFRVETKFHFQSRIAPYYTNIFDYVLLLSFPVLGAVVWQMPHHWVLVLGSLVFLILFGYWEATRVLWESVIVLPSKDLQLETHRGVIINEGLYGWNVRYYLAVLKKVGKTQSLHVLYENQLPRMPILRDVYHNLQALLFDDA